MSHEQLKQPLQGNYFELEYVGLDEGKKRIRTSNLQNDFRYPSYSPVLDKRWRALSTKWNELHNVELVTAKSGLNISTPQLLRILIDVCSEQNLMAEQREIYYAVRGKYPDLHIDGELWEDLYDSFINSFINKVQLIVKMPMQSFGVEAGARGSVAGEGQLILQDGKRVSLNAEPKLRFELVRQGVRYSGRATKHIHYEKEAGFARLISGDISQMIEAIFSNSQGYSSEAASKFLRDSEERGLQTYCIHDGDSHGLQMQMMYGVASKNNCYMADRFYPHDVVYLGLVPTVAKEIGLPPEKVDPNDRKIIPNLRKLLQEKSEFVDDVDIIDKHGQKWEYQALNAMHERAPQVYMVEALRVRNDTIKYVPPAPQLKEAISTSITGDVTSLVENQIGGFADRFYQENIKPELIKQLKEKLEPDTTEFSNMMLNELPKLDGIPDIAIREAVKLKLVSNPRQFWDNAQYQVARDILNQKFVIDSKIEWNVSVKEAIAEKELTIGNPEVPETPLTKTDITDSIQRRIITTKPARDKIVNPIRYALERVFGSPDETW